MSEQSTIPLDLSTHLEVVVRENGTTTLSGSTAREGHGLEVSFLLHRNHVDALRAALLPGSTLSANPDQERLEIRASLVAVLGYDMPFSTISEMICRLGTILKHVDRRARTGDEDRRQARTEIRALQGRLDSIARTLVGTELAHLSPQEALVKLLGDREAARKALCR